MPPHPVIAPKPPRHSFARSLPGPSPCFPPSEVSVPITWMSGEETRSSALHIAPHKHALSPNPASCPAPVAFTLTQMQAPATPTHVAQLCGTPSGHTVRDPPSNSSLSLSELLLLLLGASDSSSLSEISITPLAFSLRAFLVGGLGLLSCLTLAASVFTCDKKGSVRLHCQRQQVPHAGGLPFEKDPTHLSFSPTILQTPHIPHQRGQLLQPASNSQPATASQHS